MRMLDSYPRSGGSSVHPITKLQKGCWIPIQGPVDPVSIQLQNYKEDVGFLSKVRWIQCPSNYKITKRMLDYYPRSGGSSVHPITNYKEDVGLLSKVRWIQCPSNYKIKKRTLEHQNI